MGLHFNLKPTDGNHVLQSLIATNQTNRLAGTVTGQSGLPYALVDTATDAGRIVQQTSDNTYWMIITVPTPSTPTYREVAPNTTSLVAKAVIHWGNSGVSSTTTTRYLTPGYEDSLAPTTVIQWRVPYNGTLKNLRVRHNTTAGNGNAIVYTLRKNGTASALTASVNSTAADGNDLSNSVSVTAGDLIDIEVTKAASIATSPSDIVASMEYDAS